MKKLTLSFGATAEPLWDQIREQGFDCTRVRLNDIEILQECANAVTLLSVQLVLTDTEAMRARKRILKEVAAILKAARDGREGGA